MNWRLGAMRWDNFASLHKTWKLTAMRGYRVDLLDFDNCHLACLRDALKCQLAYYFTKMALTPCPGQSDKLSPFQESKRQRLEYRCGCLAHIKFQISNDMWEVCEFNDMHSHPMIKDNLRHFIQSGRKHTSATKNILGSMIEVGIRTKKVVRYLQNEAADVKSTQRSESTNRVFTEMTCKTMSITEFVKQYKQRTTEMCDSEAIEDYKCRGKPKLFIEDCGMLKHASSVYTR
ncbi:hypothetical protein FXO37_00005 [Capsicum annuum]|nr:hypothetical protein FXO37_00005 [Capsicum annuum]